MSNSLLFYLIVGIIVSFYFIKYNGLKLGIIYILSTFLIGLLAGLISIYFSNYMKIILSIILFVSALFLNYPPTKTIIITWKKKVINKLNKGNKNEK
tara:strand:+ start:227 stop:517 length:291 start_codon:yes stop_codon:yes gene_type:complete